MTTTNIDGHTMINCGHTTDGATNNDGNMMVGDGHGNVAWM